MAKQYLPKVQFDAKHRDWLPKFGKQCRNLELKFGEKILEGRQFGIKGQAGTKFEYERAGRVAHPLKNI